MGISKKIWLVKVDGRVVKAEAIHANAVQYISGIARECELVSMTLEADINGLLTLSDVVKAINRIAAE